MDYVEAVRLMVPFVDRLNSRVTGSSWRSSNSIKIEDLVVHAGRILEQTRACWVALPNVSGEPIAKIKTASLYLLWRDTLALCLLRSDLAVEGLVEAIEIELELVQNNPPASNPGPLVNAFLEAAFNSRSLIRPLVALSQALGESPESIVYGLFVRSTLSVFRHEMVNSPSVSSTVSYKPVDETLGWDDLHFAWEAASRIPIRDEEFFTLLYTKLRRSWAALLTQTAAPSGQQH